MPKAKRSRLVSIPKSDLDSLEATLETLENGYVMDQLERSEQDIQNGRVRNGRGFLITTIDLSKRGIIVYRDRWNYGQISEES